jgi:glycerophosphoryl diester phosphodiesterase
VSPELVAELGRQGRRLWCWTVNEGADMAALLRCGVAGITTDRPDDLLRLRERLSAR